MKKLIIIAIIFVAISIFATKTFACGGWFESACGTSTEDVKNNQQKMETVVPLPQLQSSLERKNIKKRLELWSNESKVSYIYLISYGKVMTFYVVKGKITSGSKRLTNNQMMVDNYGNLVQPGVDAPQGANTVVVSSPELDGTYGDSSPYIYFWTTDGVYVQWNGEYMLADQPLQLSTPPEMVRQIQ